MKAIQPIQTLLVFSLSEDLSSSTGGPSSQYEELYCFFFTLLCERSAKRDMGHILYYLTIELDHVKRDSRLAAYGGILLQRLEGLNL